MKQDYSRQICLPEIGPQGQEKLQGSSLLVIGIGGLGCAALPYLAAAGIGRIGMLDFDRIESSNLARQTLFSQSDIGCFKAEIAEKRLHSLYPHIHFEKILNRLTAQNAEELIAPFDVIIDATDNLEARLAINDTCITLQKPWVYGSLQQWEGQVSLFQPKSPDYRTLFPEGIHEKALPNCSFGGVLGPFAGMIGMIQAIEAIKCLLDMEDNLSGKLLLINGKTWRMNLVSFAEKAPRFEISYSEFLKWLEKEPVQLVDVRESYEKVNGDLGGISFCKKSLHKNQKIVLYCQSGVRSLAAAERLRKDGYDAYSLEGGVNAQQ